ncbi:MAG: hypothetical protein ACRD98_11835, partial [Nitrososphaera sp.]
MAAKDAGHPDPSALGWDDLVTLKRKLSGDLKVLTDRIVDLDKIQFHNITSQIKDQRTLLDNLVERQKQIRTEIEKSNDSLLAVSEKISQSKNFLSLMEARLPSEKEEELHAAVQKNQVLVESGDYKSEREKNEILSRAKDASMKLEAMRATRTIREQLAILNQNSAAINTVILQLNEEREASKAKMTEINGMLDRLYNAKRNLAVERESCLSEYDGLAKQFDAINARLDAMGEMRRKQREEYGHGLPSDALFKVKEIAKKKLESGAKLSFDEL